MSQNISLTLTLGGNGGQQLTSLLQNITRQSSQFNNNMSAASRTASSLNSSLSSAARNMQTLARGANSLSTALQRTGGITTQITTNLNNISLSRQTQQLAQFNQQLQQTIQQARNLNSTLSNLNMPNLPGGGSGGSGGGGGMGPDPGRYRWLGRTGGMIAAGAAGIYAAGRIIADPIQQARDLDIWARRQANTTIGRDLNNPGYQADVVARRIAMTKSLVRDVVATSNAAGTDLESGQAVYERLIASGLYNANENDSPQEKARKAAMLKADALLAAKGAYITGGDPGDTSNIVIQARNRGYDPQRLLSAAMVASQEGSFEIANLGRYLPTMLAYMGERKADPYGALAELLGASQVVAKVSGTPNEAGVASYNLLKKLTDNSTQNHFGDFGIDLGQELVKGALQKKSPLTVVREQTQRVWAMDPSLQVMNKKLASTTDEEQRKRLQDSIAQQQENITGKLFREMRSGRAIRGILLNTGEMNRIAQASNNPGQVFAENSAVVTSSADAGFNAASNANALNQFNAFGGMAGELGKLGKTFADLSAQYPALAAGLTAGAEAGKAAGAGLMAAAGSAWLFSRAAGTAAGASALGGVAGAAGMAIKGLGALAGALIAWEAGKAAGNYINDNWLSDDAKDVIGAIATGVRGLDPFTEGGREARAALKQRGDEQRQEMQLKIDGRDVKTSVETRQARDSRRGGGAGQW